VAQRYETYVTTPASSIDATARDMGRFLIAALGDGANQAGRFLSPAAAARIKEPQFREHPEFAGFAWGFWEVLRDRWRVIHHGGTMLGFSSELWLLPDHGLGFFFVTNRDRDAGGGPVRLRSSLTRALMERWFPGGGEARKAPEKPAAVDTAPLAGNWAATTYCHTCPEGEGWEMYYAPLESVKTGVIQYEGERWVAEGERVFVSEDSGSRLAFIEDGKGRVRYMVHDGYRLVREKLDETLLDEVFGPGWEKRDAPPLAAKIWRANGEWEKAAHAFESMAGKQAEPGRALYRAGASWLKAGKPERARSALKRAWVAGPWKARSAYGAAVACAMQEQDDQAFRWLERALEAGLSEPEMLQEDPRLQRLRADPRFAKLLEAAVGD
jgi:hypothetical protein